MSRKSPMAQTVPIPVHLVRALIADLEHLLSHGGIADLYAEALRLRITRLRQYIPPEPPVRPAPPTEA